MWDICYYFLDESHYQEQELSLNRTATLSKPVNFSLIHVESFNRQTTVLIVYVSWVFLLGRITYIAWRQPIATDVTRTVVCLSVCLWVRLSVGHTDEPYENDWTDRDAVWGGADSVAPTEPCIRWGQHRTNPFAAVRGDKSAMRPFVKIPWPLVSISVTNTICCCCRSC